MVKINIDGVSTPSDYTALDIGGARAALRDLKEGTGTGCDSLGWLRLPAQYDQDCLRRIRDTGSRIRETADAFVVVGIGGSYLGTRAALDLLRSPRYNELKKSEPNIYFIGNGISGEDLLEVMDLVRGRDFYVNVISKSGTTLEPAMAFRLLRELLVEQYGEEDARRRIICTTNPASGALRQLAESAGYETFPIPQDIGGRYSVLTAVGLLPMVVAGLDIDGVLAGARGQMERSLQESADNPALLYAAARQMLYGQGKRIEVFSYPGEFSRSLAQWWVQLFGESEGKDGKGIFPATCAVSADLHSLGQYMQDGERILFETMLCFEQSRRNPIIPAIPGNADHFDHITGQDFDRVYRSAAQGVRHAHIEGGVPFIGLSLPSATEESFGALIYFFEVACGISGYMMGVNPFDQPGVEAYKRHMCQNLRGAKAEEVMVWNNAARKHSAFGSPILSSIHRRGKS